MSDAISLDLFNGRLDQLCDMLGELRLVADSMVQLGCMIQKLDRRMDEFSANMPGPGFSED